MSFNIWKVKELTALLRAGQLHQGLTRGRYRHPGHCVLSEHYHPTRESYVGNFCLPQWQGKIPRRCWEGIRGFPNYDKLD